MNEYLLYALGGGVVAILGGGLVLVLVRATLSRLFDRSAATLDRSLRDEFDRQGTQSREAAKHLREEVNASLKGVNDSTVNAVRAIGEQQANALERVSTGQTALTQSLQQNSTQLREELRSAINDLKGDVSGQVSSAAAVQKEELNAFGQRLTETGKVVEERLSTMQSASSGRLDQLREEATRNSKEIQKELTAALQTFGTSTHTQIGELVRSVESKLSEMRNAVDTKLSELREENGKKLDEMRATVDEKLHATLEQRLGESFKLVSERLEKVHAGLGEMQALASGVGDLKRVLTNVKVRGTWAEVQLGGLLEQMLSPGQYESNVATRPDTQEKVEFAIKLPGRNGDRDAVVWLPIDAKFPLEDYQRLAEAQDRADRDGVAHATKRLEVQIRNEARSIRDKYINPPATTDFAVMFLPTEGLYAEVIRQPGLVESLQTDYRVVVAGPTTLTAILSSLQMGFRTLAIEQRSSEVWELLGAIKGEFGKFGDVLAKVQKKLGEASKTIDKAASKTRTIQRKLRAVQELPVGEAEEEEGLPNLITDGGNSSESGLNA